MVLAAGLLLNSKPFSSSSDKKVVNVLGPWSQWFILWGIRGIWISLLAEAANAWWGTQWVLKIAHDAAGLQGQGNGPAVRWMEWVVWWAHHPWAEVLSTVVCIPPKGGSFQLVD